MNWQPRGGVRHLLAASCLAAASCGSGDGAAPATTAPTTSTTAAPTTAAPTATTTATAATAAVEIALRLDDRVGEPSFAPVVRATLADPRGWQQAGFAFTFDDPDAPYTVVLADGATVDALCAPYDTGGEYSCQLGPTVALNAERWRTATPEWPAEAGLDAYRQMLVNHEVGHLLGQHHPDPQCPDPGTPAPVMAQQSTELPESGCLANPWPLPWELACAATHAEPLAPPYEPDPEATCDAQR